MITLPSFAPDITEQGVVCEAICVCPPCCLSPVVLSLSDTWLALLAIGPFLLLCCQKHPPTTAVVLNTCTDECRRNVHCTQNKSDMLQIIIDVRLHIAICNMHYDYQFAQDPILPDIDPESINIDRIRLPLLHFFLTSLFLQELPSTILENACQAKDLEMRYTLAYSEI